MARHHRNLDDWEAEHGITVGLPHLKASKVRPVANGKTVIATAARGSASTSHDRQKNRLADSEPKRSYQAR
jgi:hypothetical protein